MVTTASVDLTASTVDEGAGVDYVFTATLSSASHGVTTIHTDQGDITIADGATTGTLTIAANNGEDVYSDASSLQRPSPASPAAASRASSRTATATANVSDTVTTASVDLTASTVDEGTGVDYVFTATLSSASHGVTTIHTDQGDITIADGATTGTLTIAANNGEDVYSDASSLTASITGVSGGGFESLVVGTATATANVSDTVTNARVDLSASTVDEGAGVDYVFTATLSSASHGVTTIHTDQGDITIADGATTGTLTIAANNGEDVYSDASSLTASITGVSGGGFESLVVGTATATANVSDTVTTASVDLTASTVDEGTGVDYVFTATLSSASHGVTTIHTDQGDITIADGATTGTLVIAANNGEDVYSDASSLTASITGVSGGGFESLVVGTATATRERQRYGHHRQRRPHRLHRRRGRRRRLRVHRHALQCFARRDHHPYRSGRHHHCRRGDHRHAGHRRQQRRGRLQRRVEPTASITGVSGGGFESLVVGTATATANCQRYGDHRQRRPHRLHRR